METVGRPAHFETKEQLQECIDTYFIWIQGVFEWVDIIVNGEKVGREKEWVREPEPPTITGLALFLGFVSRQSVYDYEKTGEFSYTIKEARLRVENGYEKALMTRNSTGAIFALKNFGWTDKQEIDHKSTDGTMSPTPISFSKGSQK